MMQDDPLDPPDPSADDDRVLAAMSHYFAGPLSPEDAAFLDSLLADDADARREFLDHAWIHALLPATVLTAAGDARPLPVTRLVRDQPDPGAASRTRFATVAASVLLAAGCLLTVLVRSPAPRPPAAAGGVDEPHYDDRQFPVATVAVLHDEEPSADAAAPAAPGGRDIPPSTIDSARTGIRLTSADGTDVRLASDSRFGFASAASGLLYRGTVHARVAAPERSFAVVASNLRIVDLGTEFQVSQVGEHDVAVSVLDGDVEVQSRARLPICYWSFDEDARWRPASPAGSWGLPIDLGPAATACAGIVGRAAVAFDNTAGAYARVRGGTADKVGLGTLSAAEGISIEALFISHWSGHFMDYDEIYRKEDGTCRVLLAFQNDGTRNASLSEPEVAAGPCLSFGLHVSGRGYRELDMPLDGREGRPDVAALTDGRPHHVVATFDSFTGVKALFIDGVLRSAHTYPVGSLIMSGGPAPATIGSLDGRENFHGVIDEVALYDFALTGEEIALHAARARRGERYFVDVGLAPNTVRWQAIRRITAGTTMVFDSRSGIVVE